MAIRYVALYTQDKLRVYVYVHRHTSSLTPASHLPTPCPPLQIFRFSNMWKFPNFEVSKLWNFQTLRFSNFDFAISLPLPWILRLYMGLQCVCFCGVLLLFAIGAVSYSVKAVAATMRCAHTCLRWIRAGKLKTSKKLRNF